MFFTAFIWGLGTSCGACFGLLMFILLKAVLDWLLNNKAHARIEEYNERSLDALVERNVLTDDLVKHSKIVADSCAALLDEVKK